MLKLNRILAVTVLSFVLLVFSASTAYCQLAAEYLRNGEVYLSISSAPVALGINGVWRLNDPEGFQNPTPHFPQRLLDQTLIQNFAVDINRNIFTLSDPDQSAIGDSFMLKRQVLDSTAMLSPDGTWAHDSRSGTTGTGNLGGTTFTNVTNGVSDYGAHQFIHMDHRHQSGRWGRNTDVYRTIEDANEETRGVRRSNDGVWPSFLARRPVGTTAPANPVEYLPSGFTNNDLVLPHYQGKSWYLIPNGAWYSSWKARWTDSWANASTRIGVNWFYQVFADKAVGTQYDWRLVKHNPIAGDVTNYNSVPGVPFATTYNMAITRASLAGCLDGCGFNSNSGAVSESDMLFHAAFMPYADALGNPQVRTYSYSRTDGTSNWNLDVSGGFSAYTTFGNPVGIGGLLDTKWIGVSVAPASRDFVYHMGNSVIRDWLPSITGLNVTAVTVSNQWNQNGGILFAFDSNSGNVIRFTIDSTSSPAGTVSNFSTIQVNSILGDIGADASSRIDDIAADGFGNLFLALTYPSPDPNFNVPLALGWNYDDAIGYTSSVNEGIAMITFNFEAPYRKSVWKVSALGQAPKEVGNVEIARRPYTRSVTMAAAGLAELPVSSMLPASIDSIVASWATAELPFDASPFSFLVAGSKMAVINAPTPPEVLSIFGKNSYLDIIGPYADSIPAPNPLTRSTEQNSMPTVPGTLDLSQVYFYMVENYPLPGLAQDPRVSEDYDGDGRVSGFVSTVMDSNPGASRPNIRYIWNTWLVWRLNTDVNGNSIIEPVIPPAPSNPSNGTTNFVHAFYSPVTAGFVLTCKVQYDWFDYDQAPFGMTREQWDASPSIGRVYDHWAIPSAPGKDANDAPSVAVPSTRLQEVLDNVFADYSGSVPLATIKNQMASSILGAPSFNFYAIEGVIASGTQPPSPPPATETARIQRCNPGTLNDPLVATNWHPSSAGLMNPAQGYHGLNAGTPYRWRLDVASQAVFFDDLSDTVGLPAYNRASPDPLYNFYQFLADKLMDPTHPYFINVSPDIMNPGNPDHFATGNSTLRFMNLGDDIKWAPGSALAVESFVEYMTPTSPTPVRYNVPTDDFIVGEYTEGGVRNRFGYVTIPGNALPPTDPTVATLTIEIRRGFVVDMYGFGPDGNPLSSAPFYQQQKFLTLTGQASIMVVDSQSPIIAFSQTSPKQLKGNTGELLDLTGDVSFQIVDNNPWEGSSALPHSDYAFENVANNKVLVSNLENAGQSAQNITPVFNRSGRFVEFSYDIANVNTNKSISLATHTYYPGWGSKIAGLAPGVSTSKDLSGIAVASISAVVDPNARIFRANLKFTHPINRLGNDSSPLLIPANYANNTPGYRPYQFYIEGMDSSGNHLPLTRLNMVLHVRDTLPPNPYVIINEFKNKSYTRIPAVTTTEIESDEDWKNDFINLTAYSAFYNTSPTWLANANGQIAAYGLNNMMALPYVNGVGGNIVGLRTGLIDDAIITSVAPGNIIIEDNVDITFKVGAVDNAGVASASLAYRIFNISGQESPRGINMFKAWQSPGITGTSTEQVEEQSRAVFREGKDLEFPLAVPLTIIAHDNAREHDEYPNEDHTDNFQWSDWGVLSPGNLVPLTRTFKTTLPVYGSRLDIRTIDRGIRR